MSMIQAAATLYQLQQLDLELERLIAEQQALTRSLQEDMALNKARAEHRVAQQQLQAALQAQKEAEWVLEELNNRLHVLDQRLYGGQITNPKELSAVQQEAQHLRAQQNRQEETTLEMMDAAESLESIAQQKNAALYAAEQAWQEKNAAHLARREQLESRRQVLQEKREQVAGSIDSDLLKRYEALKRAKQGRAISRVEQSSCQWCRVILTASELQRVRASQELQLCSNCGRILYSDR